MDDADLQRRVRVIVVTTRAASSSLDDDTQAVAAILRGVALLTGLRASVDGSAAAAALDQLERGRAELAALLETRSP